jgi:mycofactocin glycosyltransferase
MPAGTLVVLDPSTERLGEDALVGGSPRRVVRLSGAGRAAYDEVVAGPVRTPAARSLARYLTDAGLAHPRPVPTAATDVATVVIPVRDRAAMLERCLASLDRSLPVLVVDDGSMNPERIADIAVRHGARLIRRDVSGGPAAARNTAIEAVDTDYVVMLDSDCVAPAGWVSRLAAHLADPLVAMVAPRIVPLAARTSAQRYAAVRGSLDLGDRAASVAPLTRVGYVPSTALVARRAALLDVARDGQVFDESMRYGEDVDLVWRLHAAGWRVRYDPSVVVRHDEPATWSALLARRFRYGTSAAPLARRHAGATQPLAVPVLPAVAVAAAVAGRPRVAVAAVGASFGATRRVRASAGLSTSDAAADTARAITQTWVGMGRYAAQFLAPVVVAGARRGNSRCRLTALALLTAPGVAAVVTSRGALDPARVVGGTLLDDLTYGAGVWRGCVREQTLRPLRPVIRGWRPTQLPVRRTSPIKDN